ncbi:type I polyketide synthase [Boudabousia tangfeifanii]|uniref:Type I polyketide synthase n=1 Tax=Boudabousia tangfeifanii TaxID=1912795 RepID=A0A1D9MKS8_9ACTO|nr:type I polyketide synthase [Boudabousia tangfeifanii]AOZ72886.1 type I polyketide synthase [Boudabousia tangfeifanii]
MEQQKMTLPVLFAGQASNWLACWQDTDFGQSQGAKLSEQVWEEAKAKLGAVLQELVTIAPDSLTQVDQLFQGRTQGVTAQDATVSMPAILLTQIAALSELDTLPIEVDLTASLGHSQGALGLSAAKALKAKDRGALVSVVALSVLLSYAAKAQVAQWGWPTLGSAMRSVRGLCQNAIDRALAKQHTGCEETEKVAVALKNGPQTFVLAGHPQSLLDFEAICQKRVDERNDELANKQRGGNEINPIWDELPINVPFHHPAFTPALEHALDWAQKCHLALPELSQLAAAILTESHDWPSELVSLAGSYDWAVNLGPGDSLTRLSSTLVSPAKLQILEGGNYQLRQAWHTPGVLDQQIQAGEADRAKSDYTRFAPKLVKLADGTTRLETAFSRLTGNSPVLLAGMTPTTVDAEIVAAAANAGYWAEMAGGGQYSPEVFNHNLKNLVAALEIGRCAQFNSMFFDRYMWNLQFGTQRIVSKARAAGAPLNGVTISAGIPEVAEATELIASLTQDGFSYIAFKPGTISQIRSVLAIAKANPNFQLIMQVEDGHAGGHHSWENLDDLLLATYDEIRATENVVLCVGGGIGTPQIAARYLLGTWSEKYTADRRPVDGILVGTAAMTCLEAKTSPEVKQLLKETPGIAPDDQGGWVGSGQIRGGVTSGLSHLHADMYEIANDSAACSRLLSEIGADLEQITARREEIIAALDKTAKPYFGDLETFTYLQWAQRFVELAYPWTDPTWPDRFYDLLQRIEARLNPADHGEIDSLFASVDDVSDGPAAIARLAQAYPQAATTKIWPADIAYFPTLCRKHHKPLPFVPVLDGDLARWWGMDTLWQSQDERYGASAVRVIPGPVSVAGIDRVDEPVAELLGRFEAGAISALEAENAPVFEGYARLGGVKTPTEFIQNCPWLDWRGHLMANPALSSDDPAPAVRRFGQSGSSSACDIVETEDGWEIVINCDTRWDEFASAPAFAVKTVRIPLSLPTSLATGAVLKVDDQRLPEAVYGLLAAVAGIGSTSASGDQLTNLPKVSTEAGSPFGRVDYAFTLNQEVFSSHLATTGAALSVVQPNSDESGFTLPTALPDALVGACWPAIYAALGSAYLPDGYPVIEGLLQAVHLDHCIDFTHDLRPFTAGSNRVEVIARTSKLEESASGRIVKVTLELRIEGELLAVLTERFAIRGRITTNTPPSILPGFGGLGREVNPIKRQFWSRTMVLAPPEMTPFALASGDFNPIHTSYRAAALVGLPAPLVHGMWLSATAQAFLLSSWGELQPGRLLAWSYSMYGMVQLNDLVELVAEQVGRGPSGEVAFEVTAKIDGQVVSRAQAVLSAPRTAYVYPGQGIQATKMGASDRLANPVVREVWEQADAHTRQAHGFSILRIVDENPTELLVRGQLLKHPKGVLHLTQFTQVALAVLAYGQTQQLRAAGQQVAGAYFAGHSLGEYTALAACANIFDLPAVIDVVYSRGSAMHSLVPRDEAGRSNYRLGALRPNQCGLDEAEIEALVASIATQTGEFLQIVNYNVASRQYAVAGTIAGLDALAKRAEELAALRGGKRPYIKIPGIDVPFHSSVLANGVPAFAQTLERLLPTTIDVEVLVGRYLPNLVALPFALTRDFAEAIVGAAPAQRLADLLAEGDEFERLAANEPERLARILLVELLSWQFASPVRWIETQELLFTPVKDGGLGIDHLVEIGLAASPTLANLAKQTLSLPQFSRRAVKLLNLERDQVVVLANEAIATPALSAELEQFKQQSLAIQTARQNNLDLTTVEASTQASSQDGPVAATTENAIGQSEVESPATLAQVTTPAQVTADSNVSSTEETPADSASSANAQAPTQAASSAQPSQSAATSGVAPEARFTAKEAALALFAWQTKLRTSQVLPADTMDTLTNGVSSRRNQLLMDLAAELQVASIEGASEASVETLLGKVVSAAPTYKPLGPVLQAVVDAQLRPIWASAGAKLSAIESRLRQHWQLPDSWLHPVLVNLLLGLREGDSLRGGSLSDWELSSNPDQARLLSWIDQAVAEVATELNYQLPTPGNEGPTSGNVQVDSAALSALAEAITGEQGILAKLARTTLAELGLANAPVSVALDEAGAQLLAKVETELGPKWLESVSNAFDPKRAVLFNDRWASAREDLARWGQALAASPEAKVSMPDPSRFAGLGKTVSHQAKWWAGQVQSQAKWFEQVSDLALESATGRFQQEVALVTGAAPNSIAGALVADLLQGGATVIMTASRIDDRRLNFARELYAENANAQAKLWLVPANLNSFQDIDDLLSWVTTAQTESVGQVTKVLKPALLPTLLFPFAAGRVFGSLAEAGPATERQARILLWSVERLLAGLAQATADYGNGERVHVVLPGSPNRGTFGGDGPYGEVKAAFDAIVNKWQVESVWPQQVTLARAHIGWVSGTNLMGANDALVPAAKEAGIEVYTPAQISEKLLDLCSPKARAKAAKAPLEADLTGGLAQAKVHLPTLAAQVAAQVKAAQELAQTEAKALEAPKIKALPNITLPTLASSTKVGPTSTKLSDLVVLVGTGEVSAWGSGRTRQEAEYGISRDGSVELTAAGVLELAWMMGLLTWAQEPQAGWYDQSGELVPEAEIYERYREEVTARCGVREFVNDSTLVDLGSLDAATVYLESDVEFTVPSEEIARAYQVADPTATYFPNDEGEFVVRKLAGSQVLVPKKATLTRTVGGQLPTDFDPAKWGLPVGMLDGMDRIAAWNLVTCVDAFLSAGFTPAELLTALHPSQVASTQGTGIGGMESLRQVFLDRFLGKDRPQDILQEALPNVVAAHVMQAYVGGYGAMIHPVAACATAAVSLEEGVDKILVGKAKFVVTGGIDDISVESLTGFGEMNATADSAAMAAKGINPRFFSRANDARRGGFVEAAGGGTALLARGDVAAELGLPVLAVVAHAQSFADGAHTSIPAPGIGALAAGCGYGDSRLAQNLAKLGLSANDVKVVSKHDTSTNANDPNESLLHATLWPAIGRETGNPQYVISQKSLTGHAKGGAALFQLAGLAQVLRTGKLPGNAALDCVDEAIAPKSGEFVWLRSPLDLGPGAVKAAALTSLGFGHVSALVVLAHPSCFEAVLQAEGGNVAAWRQRASERLQAGARRLSAAMIGQAKLYEPVEKRRLPQVGADESERAMLLDPQARLASNGRFQPASEVQQ